MAKENVNYKWQDKKRTIFGLPLSFTTYKLTENKLIIEKGFFTKTEEEIRLYRILDISLKRNLREQIFGLGTVHICSADKTSPEYDILHIKNSQEFKEMLSDMVESERENKRIGMGEIVG